MGTEPTLFLPRVAGTTQGPTTLGWGGTPKVRITRPMGHRLGGGRWPLNALVWSFGTDCP
jgi:hypothetical protein